MLAVPDARLRARAGEVISPLQSARARCRRAVLKSLVPIVLGHEASIAVVVGTVVIAEAYLVPDTVRLLAALGLAGVGPYKVARPGSHPRGFGVRVGLLGLAAWSFLMSSADGAGLILAPVLAAPAEKGVVAIPPIGGPACRQE